MKILVSKYKPEYRHPDGHYLRDEWTSYHDLGRIYDNKKFESSEYYKIEDEYCMFIRNFMNAYSIKSLKIKGLELSLYHRYKLVMKYGLKILSVVREGKILNIDEILKISRMCLREEMWCQLVLDDIYIYFGYDYYLFIGAKDKKEINCPPNLYIDENITPFLEL